MSNKPLPPYLRFPYLFHDPERPRCTAKQAAKVLLCLLRSDQKLNLNLKSTTGVQEKDGVKFIEFDADGYKFIGPCLDDRLQDIAMMLTPGGSEYLCSGKQESVRDELETLWVALEGSEDAGAWEQLIPMVLGKWELRKAEDKGVDLGSLHNPDSPVTGCTQCPGGPREDAPLPEKSVPQVGFIKVFQVTIDGDPVEACKHDRGVTPKGLRFPGNFIPQNIFYTEELAREAANKFFAYWQDIPAEKPKSFTDKKPTKKKGKK